MTGPVVYRKARPQYLTVRAFAEHFGTSYMTINRLVVSGDVKAIRIGRLLRIPATEIARFAEAAAVEVDTE